MRWIALVLALSLGPQMAHADTAPLEPAPKSEGADLSFDLFGDHERKSGPSTEARRAQRLAQLERKVALRRRLLTGHQIAGFTTLGLLAATLVLGQLNWVHQFGGAQFTQAYNAPHLGLAVVTSIAFTTTGALALAAPNPYPKPLRADRALLHKISMMIATAGMVTQLVLGPISASLPGTTTQRHLSIAHLGVGYVSFAAMAVGTLSFVF